MYDTCGEIVGGRSLDDSAVKGRAADHPARVSLECQCLRRVFSHVLLERVELIDDVREFGMSLAELDDALRIAEPRDLLLHPRVRGKGKQQGRPEVHDRVTQHDLAVR